MKLLFELSKMIPRDRLREWGGGSHSRDRSFPRGYTDAEAHKIRRKKGRKNVDNVLVTEEDVRFTVHGKPEVRQHSTTIHVMRNHPDDGYYDTYKGIKVTFWRNGDVTHEISDKAAKAEWDAHEEEIVKAARAAAPAFRPDVRPRK